MLYSLFCTDEKGIRKLKCYDIQTKELIWEYPNETNPDFEKITNTLLLKDVSPTYDCVVAQYYKEDDYSYDFDKCSIVVLNTENGNMSKENLDKFTNEFCVAKSRTTSTGPREFVKLFNEDGEVLARRCSVTHKWLLPDDFNGDIAKMSISREANKAKTKNVRDGEAIEREALNILTEARSETDATAKLELFEKINYA